MSSLEDSWVSNYYTTGKEVVICDICYEEYRGNSKIANLCRHLTSHHEVEENKAKRICDWLSKFFIKNKIDTNYCCCKYCNNDILSKSIYLIIHLKQVHEFEIPSDIKPAGLWSQVAHIDEWTWECCTTDLLTEDKICIKCKICGERLLIGISVNNIINHIKKQHKKVYDEEMRSQVPRELNLFSIENNQLKCNSCNFFSPLHYSNSNKELEDHLSNKHKLNYAQINDLVNGLIMYRNTYIQTSECKTCKNIFPQQYFSLIRHLIKEHSIGLHLISEKLLDKLKIFNSDNDTEDVALPGSSSQQTDQSINQSSSKITSRSSNLYNCSNYDQITNSDVQITFLQEFEDAN
ncbi:uncharacterized protein LOC114939412 [Nylanderia fulva]|uniref:uncharacterized protein LOC114939412 n=1 Tax=Nylanderia fulva TaxID=613905 RepID=UPI0010FB32EA|nr:uncharacterized protein LOC114939412 [Nylanderia fulva]